METGTRSQKTDEELLIVYLPQILQMGQKKKKKGGGGAGFFIFKLGSYVRKRTPDRFSD